MRNKLLITLASLSLLLLTFATYNITSIIIQDKKGEEKNLQLVEEFKESISKPQESPQNHSVENASPEEQIPMDTHNEPDEKPNEITLKADGVISIPSINLEAPLKFTSIYDAEQTKKVIRHHVGVYSDFGVFGQEQSNTVLSAHSSLYPRGCSWCFFNYIDELSVGDVVDVLWNDGYKYSYEVSSIDMHQDPTSEWFYEVPLGDEQILTMITCTRGDPQNRTVVKAKLFSTETIN